MPTLIETADTYGPSGLFTAVSIYESQLWTTIRADAENFRRAYSWSFQYSPTAMRR